MADEKKKNEETKDKAKNWTKDDEEKYQKWIKDLKAQRLDEVEACNIQDPNKDRKAISACGCHFSINDMKQAANDLGLKYPKDIEKIAEKLNTTSKYSTLPDNAKNLDLSDKAIVEWYISRGGKVKSEYLEHVGIDAQTKKNIENPDNTSIPDDIKKESDGLKEHLPTDDIKQVAPGSGNITGEFGQPGAQGQTLKKDDYIPWLCKLFNELCRADNVKPQIPTSVAVSIALAMTGVDTANMGKYNFWKLQYDQTISGLSNESGMCGFSSDADGARGCLAFAHKNSDALIGLDDKMENTTEENKKKVTQNLLVRIDSLNANNLLKTANDYVEKHKLREWDTNKKESEGGHADTKRDNNSAINKLIQQAMQKTIESLSNKGVGFQFIPRGADHTEVIKLPIGKTPCEPIYPDFIEVGDTVPEWVLSQTYAQVRNEIQQNSNGGTLNDSANKEREKKLEVIEKEIAKFKEDQFAKWVQKEGLKYTNDEEKKEAKKKYEEAANTDSEHFIDGIYIPDESDKAIYDNLLKKQKDAKNEIESNVDKKENKTNDEKKDKADNSSEKKNDKNDEKVSIPKYKNMTANEIKQFIKQLSDEDKKDAWNKWYEYDSNLYNTFVQDVNNLLSEGKIDSKKAEKLFDNAREDHQKNQDEARKIIDKYNDTGKL